MKTVVDQIEDAIQMNAVSGIVPPQVCRAYSHDEPIQPRIRWDAWCGTLEATLLCATFHHGQCTSIYEVRSL